jgi:serine/threonine-protein kinase HipA
MELSVEYAAEGLGAARPVGRLYENRDGTVFFEYDESWRSTGIELSPIYLPLSTTGAVVSPTRSFGPMFGLFEDALPDWWGEQLMRRFFGDLGIPWNRVTSLQKLACGGDRKIGALVFRPVIQSPSFRDHLRAGVEKMVEAAEAVAHGETGEILERLIPSGLTPGGAQPKAVLSFSDDFTTITSSEPPDDTFTPWLLKFDLHPELQEGGIEYAFNRMARAAGIDVPECRLMKSHGGSRSHFMVRRFERAPGGRRIHMHSFSGLTHSPPRDGLDYHDLMNLARELTRDHRSVEQLFRRAVFNIAAGNDDDHGRNHAFLMDVDGSWRLAPAYDITLAGNPLTSGIRAASVRGKTHSIRRIDLARLAEEHGVRGIDGQIDQVLEAITHWPSYAKEADIPSAIIHGCQDRMPGLG